MYIIFADDDEDDHFLMEQILNEVGISVNVFKARNGKEVLNYLTKEVVLPDIILLDINMPIMDGMTTLEQIRTKQIYTNIRIILFSTTVDPEMAKKAYQLGANLYLRKPNKYADYLHIVKTLLTGGDISNNGLFVQLG